MRRPRQSLALPHDPRDLPEVDEFLDAVVPRPEAHHKSGSLAPAKAILRKCPTLPLASVYAACAAGNVRALKKLLAKHKSLARRSGGVRGWPPLCYLAFSRFLRDEKSRVGEFVRCAKLLLDAGADPN